MKGKKKDVSTMNKDWLSRHSSVCVSGIVQTAQHLLLPSISISVSGPSVNIKQVFDPFSSELLHCRDDHNCSLDTVQPQPKQHSGFLPNKDHIISSCF